MNGWRSGVLGVTEGWHGCSWLSVRQLPPRKTSRVGKIALISIGQPHTFSCLSFKAWRSTHFIDPYLDPYFMSCLVQRTRPRLRTLKYHHRIACSWTAHRTFTVTRPTPMPPNTLSEYFNNVVSWLRVPFFASSGLVIVLSSLLYFKQK